MAPARFDLGEKKEFKFNFHFIFQLGETCKTADAKAAFLGERKARVFSWSHHKELHFRVKTALLVVSAPLLSTAETWTGHKALSRTFNLKLSPVNIMDTEYPTSRNDGGLSPLSLSSKTTHKAVLGKTLHF